MFSRSIEKNVLASFLLALMVAIGMGSLVFSTVLKTLTFNRQVIEAGRVLDAIFVLREDLLDVETGERGYVITGDAAYLQPHQVAMSKLQVDLSELKESLVRVDTPATAITELADHVARKIQISAQHITAREQNFELARVQVAEGVGRSEMDTIRTLLGKLQQQIGQARNTMRNERDATLSSLKTRCLQAGVLLLCGLAFFYFRLLRLMQERSALEDQAKHLATHDALTGLPNRRLLMEYGLQAVQRSKRNKRMFAVLFLDLNGFKPINDRYGHEAGDLLLQQVAQRLSDSLRACDRVARLGGDEFVLLLEDLADAEDAKPLHDKIVETIASPFILPEIDTVHISASIGLAIWPDDGADMKSLMFAADTRMYAAKRGNKSKE